MAIKFHPDATEPVRLPLACDESIINANDAETIAAYLLDSDPSRLAIPTDSTIITIAPMGTRARARVQRMYDEHPGEDAGEGMLAEWLMTWSIAQCVVGLKHISDFPDVIPTSLMTSGLELYPRDTINRLPFAAVAEAAAHIRRVSELDRGKEPSPEQASGSPTSESQASGIASSASTTTDSTNSVDDAPDPSSRPSVAQPSATA